ncbi:MAG: squalene/phytoene synthase family protein [Rhodospirillaceae bacterium]|nr:squalene/phytoene synthase family protein [Rhodospirillaceae bacterium]
MPTDSPKTRVDYTDLTAATLRDNDRDLYLCTLFVPKAHRSALLALYAFNAEVTRASRGSSEAAIGHMRLKWWYDALDDIFNGNPPHHPVAQALAAVVAQGLEKEALAAVIEAHAEDMVRESDFSANAQQSRAAELWGSIFEQAASLAKSPTPHTEAAAKAWGLTMTLRRDAVPPDAVRILHDAARANLDVASGHLPMVLAGIYLKRIHSAGYDLSQPIARRNDPGGLALPKLWWAARAG